MGCGSSADVASTIVPPVPDYAYPEKNAESPVVEELRTEPEVEVQPTPVPTTTTFKQVHSAIRWGKPLAEVSPLLNIEGAAVLPDPQTGNVPIHIAAQNGHTEIVHYLANTCKVDVNVTNAQGNTPLHMAIEYDYLETALLLIQFRASKTLSNKAGQLSGKGIEGAKSIELLGFAKAENERELLKAMSNCDANIKDLDKSTFISVGLKKKKAVGPQWTDEVQVKFKSILGKA
jgi:hypothetical protein